MKKFKWWLIVYDIAIVILLLMFIAIAYMFAYCLKYASAQLTSYAEHKVAQTSVEYDDPRWHIEAREPEIVTYDDEESLEADENYPIEQALLRKAHKIDNCVVTFYDVCKECCGKTDGIGAAGYKVTPYSTVAVDPTVIPFGSDVLIDYGDGEIEYHKALDAGGSIKGKHIDVLVSSHTEASELGVKTATVYWISPDDL